MKKFILLAVLALPAVSSAAHEIEGTMVLKGSLKSKVFINAVETTCRAEVEKVKNILAEDSYGNPGYRVRLKVTLDGRDEKRKIEIKQETKVSVTNFFKVGDKVEARDLNYADDETATGTTLDISPEGRLVKVKVAYKNQFVTCLF